MWHAIRALLVKLRFHPYRDTGKGETPGPPPHPLRPPYWIPNTLTASDRRILLANWFFKASNKALQGEAKRKYFEHAGALLTADGTDDNLIKLEGTPPGYRIQI